MASTAIYLQQKCQKLKQIIIDKSETKFAEKKNNEKKIERGFSWGKT